MRAQKPAALTAFCRPKDAAKAASVVRTPPFEAEKSGVFAGWRFTAR
jgi:hypothetical protein